MMWTQELMDFYNSSLPFSLIGLDAYKWLLSFRALGLFPDGGVGVDGDKITIALTLGAYSTSICFLPSDEIKVSFTNKNQRVVEVWNLSTFGQKKRALQRLPYLLRAKSVRDLSWRPN